MPRYIQSESLAQGVDGYADLTFSRGWSRKPGTELELVHKAQSKVVLRATVDVLSI